MDPDIKECIEMFDIEIPYYVEFSNKKIRDALYDKNINLVKSLIAYKNHLIKLDKKLDNMIYKLSK